MSERSRILVSMNRLSTERRVAVVQALVEGVSINATCRMTGVAKNTVLKLLADLGTACAAYHDENVRDLSCLRIQADEVWSFCYAKAKNVPAEHEGEWGYGDVWTWTALCADSKFMVSWTVGDRSADTATYFMEDVESRLANRVQLTTDGHRAYLRAVESAFGAGIDYAVLHKLYGKASDGPETRYSPARCIGVSEHRVMGRPDAKHINTSYVERQNLTMRMSMRRFTRLTNGFSKKIENLEHAIALYFMYYNFCRPHMSLKGLTPAQRLGIADGRWSIEKLVGLLDPQTVGSN